MQKIKKLIKKLRHPQVRRRMKMAIIIWLSLLFGCVTFKIGLDLGHFQEAAHKKILLGNESHEPSPLITTGKAQQVVSTCLNESPYTPKTQVKSVLKNDLMMTPIIVERDSIKKIGWILSGRYYMEGPIINEHGDNLTELYAKQYLPTR